MNRLLWIIRTVSFLAVTCTAAVGESVRETEEQSLGAATKLEIWWRAARKPGVPGVVVYRLVTDQAERCWLYGGGAEDLFMMSADKIVARNRKMLEEERAKGRLHVVYQDTRILSGKPPSDAIQLSQVVVFFFGDGDWDRPKSSDISIVGWPILQGEAHPPTKIEDAGDKLVATILIDAPAKERIHKIWQFGRSGGP